MIERVGIRELKTHTSSIMQRVREEGAVVEITYHGEVVARLVPVRAGQTPDNIEAVLSDMDQLAAEIQANWPDGVSAVEAVADARRDW